jgi:hypothetical protein
MSYKINVTHLYPENLNLYGDTGNIVILLNRLERRGVDVEVQGLEVSDELDSGWTDIYFMGGGQDADQVKVVDDFHNLKQKSVKEDIDKGAVFLGVCGGYQLMGESFLMQDGSSTRGLGVIQVETRAPGAEVKERCIGNLVAKISEEILSDMKSMYLDEKGLESEFVVGFENHAGQTFITSDKVKPLATTVKGFGNNASATHEGAVYKHVFGSYMHGPIFSKNPHFADYLIWKALNVKYDKDIKLERLDDTEEYAAHEHLKSIA